MIERVSTFDFDKEFERLLAEFDGRLRELIKKDEEQCRALSLIRFEEERFS